MWPAEEKAGDRQGVRGNESCPLASQLVSLLGLHFLGRQGRDRGGGGGSRAREGPHPLSSVNLAGLVRSAPSFLSMLGLRVWPPSVLTSGVGCW